MVVPIAMPKLGMTMAEGRVIAWPIAVGRRVAKGEVVLVIESEKAEVEIEAPAAGVLRHVFVAPDTTVACGTILGAITETADEPFDADAFRRAHDRPEAPPARRATPSPATPVAAAAARTAVGVTPAARARARELGIDPGTVPGSGPGGRVTREDVEAYAARREALVRVAAGVHLEVLAAGSGDPVLLLPGFGTDVAAFARQIPVLAERFRVLAVNPRGVGLSDAPAGDYDMATLAADAAAVVETPVHVVGASLGAAVALEMALLHPDRVRSLTLVTPLVTASPRLLAVLDAWCRLGREAPPETLARTLLPWLFSQSLLADAAARERIVRGLAEIVARVPAATLERVAAALRAWSGTRTAALTQIRAPTLVLIAGADLLTPDGEAVATAIPGARRVTVPGVGHALGLEAAPEVNAAILAHLAGV
jgi:pimeloyl-ACP methyl ester carboxylesterase